MRILTSKNGLALVSVVALMLVLTLLVPAMLNYSHSATVNAVTGTDKQKASYLARSATEMAIAAYKAKKDEPDYLTAFEELEEGKTAAGAALTAITTDKIHMLIDTTQPDKTLATTYVSDSTYKTDASYQSARYVHVGDASVEITYVNEVRLFKVDRNTRKGEDVTIMPGDSDAEKARKQPYYTEAFGNGGDIKTSVIQSVSETKGYYYLRMFYKQYVFIGSAAVNGVSASRKATIIKTVDTAAETWIDDQTRSQAEAKEVLGVLKEGHSGLNEVFVDKTKATALIPITYVDVNVNGGKVTEDVLVYSTVGNLLVDTLATYSAHRPSTAMLASKYEWIVNNIPLVLTTEFGKGYAWEDLYGVGSEHMRGYTVTRDWDYARQDNFVVFSATGSIQVNLAVDVSLNPCKRGNDTSQVFGDQRLGDADYTNAQASLYKSIVFSGTDIVFKGKVINMVSFFIPLGGLSNGGFTWTSRTASGKRAGTVVLSAPESTPYTYYNEERGKYVKAGKVSFEQDVYIVVIDRNDEGMPLLVTDDSSVDSRQTVYDNFIRRIFTETPVSGMSEVGKKSNNYVGTYVVSYAYDENYKVYKLFNAGDVYLFNSEVETEYNKKDIKVGVSLVNWFVDSQYINMRKAELGEGNNIFQDIKNWAVGMFYDVFYGLFEQGTYKASDMYYLGNVMEGTAEPVDDVEDDLYIVWDS